MKKLTPIFIILGFLLVTPFARASIVSDTAVIDVAYTLGEPQPSPETFTLTNTENSTVSLTLSKGGDASPFFTLDPSGSLTFEPYESKTINISFSIPSTTEPNLYTGTISWNGNNILILIRVLPSASVGECRIVVIPDFFSISLQGNAPLTTKKFNVKIPDCTNGIELLDISLEGTIGTDEGPKPARIKEATLGMKYPGDEIYFIVEFDPSGIEKGTYNDVKGTITGCYQGQVVSKTVFMPVTIVSGVSPLTNATFATLPSCTIPQDMNMNETYELTCTDVNPNLDIS